jgi:hypothetical protein
VRELSEAVAAFEAEQPWAVDVEPGGGRGKWVHRFRMTRSIPTDLAAIVGDAVHDMRSALDHVAHELARMHLGRLSSDQESATEFTSYTNEAEFEQYLSRGVRRGQGATRRDLSGPRGVAALKSIQPFAFASEAAALGVDVRDDPGLAKDMDVPYRLGVLWNLDKHRRLLRLAWYADDLVCLPGAPGESLQVFPRQTPPAPLADGTVLGRVHVAGEHDGPVEAKLDFNLGLVDDPCPFPGEDVRRLLGGWLDNLGGWVIPRAFATASADGPPPVFISGGWPYR